MNGPGPEKLISNLYNKIDALDNIPIKNDRGGRYYIASTPACMGSFFQAVAAKNNKISSEKVERCLSPLVDLFYQCEEYKNYLQKKIDEEMRAADLYISFQRFVDSMNDNPMYEMQKEHESEQYTQIRRMAAYHNRFTELVKGYARINESFNDLVVKHTEICNLQKILCKSNLNGEERLKQFKLQLRDRLPLITKRRDDFMETFLKGVGVILAFVVTAPLFGVGGYLAYKSLFTTRGSKFAVKAEKTAIVPLEEKEIELLKQSLLN